MEDVHTFEEEGKPVKVATLLFVFDICNARISAPFLSYVPPPFVLLPSKSVLSKCMIQLICKLYFYRSRHEHLVAKYLDTIRRN